MNDVIHTALWTADVDTMERFYTEGLGLERRWSFTSAGVENVYIGGTHGTIQWKHAPGETARAGSPDGMDHIAIAVPSVDDWFSRLVEHFDPPVLTSPMTMEQIDRRGAFVADPHGYTGEPVEIL